MKKVSANWIEEMLFDEYRQSKDVLASLEKRLKSIRREKLVSERK